MPMLPQLYTYKGGPIEEIVMPGETVGIWVNKVYEFYKVVFIETIPRSDPVAINLGALAAGGGSAVTQVTLLQMPDLEFAQFRLEVLDDVEVIVSQGRADQRHKLQQRVATLGRFSPLFDPCGHLSECYEFEDNYIFLQGTNRTAYALAQTRVVAWGFRYVTDPLTEYSWRMGKLPDVWTRVPATAHL